MELPFQYLVLRLIFLERVLCAVHILSVLCTACHVIFTPPLRGSYCDPPHFANGGTEAQGVTELPRDRTGFELRLSGPDFLP